MTLLRRGRDLFRKQPAQDNRPALAGESLDRQLIMHHTVRDLLNNGRKFRLLRVQCFAE
jgi:hypothetical protein